MESFRARYCYDTDVTEAEEAAEIAARAVEVFRDHSLERFGDHVWLASRGGRRAYQFWVVRVPGGWTTYGDLDTDLTVIRCDSVGWLRGAVGSPQYFAEKVRNCPTTWRAADAMAYLDDPDCELSVDARTEVAEWWVAHDREPRSFMEAASRHTWMGHDPGQGLSSRVMWAIECFRWFCDHVVEPVPEPPWRPAQRPGAVAAHVCGMMEPS